MREICVSDGWDERYASSASAEKARSVKTIVANGTFWSKVASLRKHMKPLKSFIRLTDSNCHTTEHVYPGMVTVEEHWSANAYAVPAPFRTFSLREHKTRFEWMLFPIHYATYACSPRYHSDNVFGLPKVMRGTRDIIRHFSHSTDNFNRAMAQFTAFKNAVLPAESLSDEFLNSSTSREWWQTFGSPWSDLQSILLRAYRVGTASSASERNFSTWDHIWGNKRSCLTFERAHKLVYCHFNLRALQELRNPLPREGNGVIPASWLDDRIAEGEE